MTRLATSEERASHRASVRAADDPEAALSELFAWTEAKAEHDQREREARKQRLQFASAKLKSILSENFEFAVDSVMLWIIVVNAVFQGIQMDRSDGSTPWIIADAVFSAFFLIEIGIKVKIHGICGQFCGPSRFVNCFDALLVAIDLFQLTLLVGFPDFVENEMGSMPAASVLRLMKLFKLGRVLRLLKMDAFKDLLTMIQGMIGGFPTLLWAMVMMVLVTYFMSLLFKEFFGKEQVEHVYTHFRTVPQSMFTSFRCAFGDCSSSSGVPIFEHVLDYYGPSAGVFYCFFVFTLSVGIMNVIAAIFVESTMVAASGMLTAKKEERMRDKTLWNTRIMILIRLMAAESGVDVNRKTSQLVPVLSGLQIPVEAIDAVVQTPEGCQALLDLDVGKEDHDYLADILDADKSGACDIGEMIDGISRLRGEPRRSDIVSIDLMVRVLQRQVGEILSQVRTIPDFSTFC
uniref:Ion transport domain-containing protein n=1 Tax=Zooxanthella nutricula TaxID=1333877 RepID=A0A7S2QKK5_9DINO